MRPLNQVEQQRDQESAWEIKMGEATSLSILNRKHQMMIDESRRSIEVLAEGQGKVIMLKNKYRFGLDAAEDENYQSELRAIDPKTRCNSAMKLHQSTKKYPQGASSAVYRSHSSFVNKESHKKIANGNNQARQSAQHET